MSAADVTSVTISAVPGMGLVALEIDDHAVILQPAAAMQTGLLIVKASLQAAAANVENLGGLATMMAGIDEMLECLVSAPTSGRLDGGAAA